MRKRIEHQSRFEERLYEQGYSFDGRLPEIGSTIVLNVVGKDAAHTNLRQERAVVKEISFTDHLVLCIPVINGEVMTYHCTYRIADFLKKLIVFETVSKPFPKSVWGELDVEDIRKSKRQPMV